jgi:hypothetical protein
MTVTAATASAPTAIMRRWTLVRDGGSSAAGRRRIEIMSSAIRTVRLIEATRQYIYDFDEAVASSSRGEEGRLEDDGQVS